MTAHSKAANAEYQATRVSTNPEPIDSVTCAGGRAGSVLPGNLAIDQASGLSGQAPSRRILDGRAGARREPVYPAEHAGSLRSAVLRKLRRQDPA